MNRTSIFLATAAALALVALVVGLPRLSGAPATAPAPFRPAPQPPPASVANGSLKMDARLSHPFIALGRQSIFVTVDLRAVELPQATRAPVNLALVIDRSGSMAGFKLNQAKQAGRQLVSQLTSTDRLTIVHYGSDVKSLEGLLATPENKARMLSYIDGIWDEGGTNIGAALAASRDSLAKAKSDFRVNRLILVSDGQPTEGVTDFGALTSLVRGIRGLGISVSSLGVGDDFNEQLMTAIAEVGAGGYGYLQDASQLAHVFQKDLNAAATQVASGVALTFTVPPGARLEQVLGYSQVTRASSGSGEVVTVALPDFAAGQQERLVAQLSVEGAADNQGVEVSDLRLTYRDLLNGGDLASEAHLAAMATVSQATVAKNLDKEAIVFSTRARAAANAEQAAQRLERGDRAGARQLLKSNLALFDEASGVAGAAAVADDRRGADEQLLGAEKAQSDGDVRIYKKAVNAKARRDYGLMGSTY
jgi:Ca-activated chloride channel family protein